MRLAPTSRCRGATLIELLVAAALAAGFAALAVAVASGALQTWTRSSATLAANNPARLALDQLARDLEMAVVGSEGVVWLAATLPETLHHTGTPTLWIPSARQKPADSDPRSFDPAASRAGVAFPGALEEARFGQAGLWLRFFTARPGEATSATARGNPTAVSYKIVRRRATSSSRAEIRYLLFRSEVRTATTASGRPGSFAAGEDLDPAIASLYSQVATRNDGSVEGDPYTLTRPPLGDVVADHVIDFGLRLYAWERASAEERPALRLIFPADGEGNLSNLSRAHLVRGPTAATHLPGRFPVAADLFLRVLTDEGAKKLAAYEDGRIGGDWWEIAEAHSRVFTRRVFLRAAPLGSSSP